MKKYIGIAVVGLTLSFSAMAETYDINVIRESFQNATLQPWNSEIPSTKLDCTPIDMGGNVLRDKAYAVDFRTNGTSFILTRDGKELLFERTDTGWVHSDDGTTKTVFRYSEGLMWETSKLVSAVDPHGSEATHFVSLAFPKDSLATGYGLCYE